MLRKDVKIGFVVGGILIATLIAYVITAGRGKPRTVELAEGETVQQVQPAGSEASATVAEAVPQPDPTPPVASTPDASTPNASAVQTKTPDPFQPSGNRDVWATALNSGTVLMSVTPSASRETTAEPAIANTAVAATEATASGSTASESVPSLLPTTQPAATLVVSEPPQVSRNTRSHVIQKGEILTGIAIAAYGDQKYWKQIAAANPAINPNRLKVGQTIALPEIAAKKERIAGAYNGGVTSPVISKSQYEVKSGDSLRRIAMKLYGREAMWQKIYELNKAQIGADPARLKLHTVLKLPEAPTNAIAGR